MMETRFGWRQVTVPSSALPEPLANAGAAPRRPPGAPRRRRRQAPPRRTQRSGTAGTQTRCRPFTDEPQLNLNWFESYRTWADFDFECRWTLLFPTHGQCTQRRRRRRRPKRRRRSRVPTSRCRRTWSAPVRTPASRRQPTRRRRPKRCVVSVLFQQQLLKPKMVQLEFTPKMMNFFRH